MTVMPTKKEVAVADAVAHLLDEAISRHSGVVAGDPETFIQCHMCGKWEEHAAMCPVPYLQAWLDEPWPSEVRKEG